MIVSKFGRKNRWGLLGGVSSIAATAAVVACSGGSVSTEPVRESTRESTEALKVFGPVTQASCQALDIAAAMTTSDGDLSGPGGTMFAVDIHGNVWGWGYNGAWSTQPYSGGNPMGFDNRQANVQSPIQLPITNATKIAAHQQGLCAITNPPGGAAGTVVCIGQALGQAGPADPAQSTAAQVVVTTVQQSAADGTLSPLTGAIGITAGHEHACVWKANGSVWCWGSDGWGQFGDASTTSAGGSFVTTASPNAIEMVENGASLADVSQVVAAGDTTCVLHKTTGKVECAGRNGIGELGIGGAPTNSPNGNLAPINVSSTTTFSAIYGGGFNALNSTPGPGPTFCAVTAAQTTLCWGNNVSGAANPSNPSTTTLVTQPYQISNTGSAWAEGQTNACEITSAGAVSCWGANDLQEIAGAGATSGSSLITAETPIPGVSGAYKVVAGYKSLCALANNALWCWGDNRQGEIGNGSTTQPGTETVSKIRLSVPETTCGANSCGTLPANACQEAPYCGDCGGGVGSGNNLCINNQCQLNPNYCPNGCGAGSFCQNRACIAYCAANPADKTIVNTGFTSRDGFSVTSPTTYGSSGCDSQFVIDIQNLYGGRRAIVSPGVNVSQAECSVTQIKMSIYANGQLQSSIGPFVGVWRPQDGLFGAYCDFAGPNYQNEMYIPYNVTEARIAASAERATFNKVSEVWETIPVRVAVAPLIF